MTREEARKILSELWPPSGGTVSWDDLIPVAKEIQRLRAMTKFGEWQPIETAPRDGTRILVIWGKYGTQIAHWHSWDAGPGYKAGACWSPESRHCPINVDPSVWQPLPEPPQ